MKLARRIIATLLGLVALAIVVVLVRFYVLLPEQCAPLELSAPATEDVIARGRYLAHHVAVCMGCHSEVDLSQPGDPLVEGRLGSGRDFGDLPGFPGRIRTANLTADVATGIGAWSDGEIVRAMREGIGRDGRVLFPMMPYPAYAETLSDDDALAIVAYLRTLPAIENDPGRTEIDFPVSMFVRAVPRPVENPAGPPPTDALARGKWLLRVGNCVDCHDTVDERRQPIDGMHLAGAQAFPLPGGGTVYAANLTADPATGLGAYSDDDILRALTDGVGKSGRPLYVMPWRWYAGLTEDDQRALVLALRQVPAVAHVVPPANLDGG